MNGRNKRIDHCLYTSTNHFDTDSYSGEAKTKKKKKLFFQYAQCTMNIHIMCFFFFDDTRNIEKREKKPESRIMNSVSFT